MWWSSQSGQACWHFMPAPFPYYRCYVGLFPVQFTHLVSKYRLSWIHSISTGWCNYQLKLDSVQCLPHVCLCNTYMVFWSLYYKIITHVCSNTVVSRKYAPPFATLASVQNAGGAYTWDATISLAISPPPPPSGTDKAWPHCLWEVRACRAATLRGNIPFQCFGCTCPPTHRLVPLHLACTFSSTTAVYLRLNAQISPR